MSIWCSWPSIGADADEPNGHVLAYALGWSNHYPSPSVETPATVDIAHVAPWCVPGHEECRECDQGAHVGEWLRLTLSGQNAPNWFEEDEQGQPTRRSFGESVVMDRAAVEALVRDLTEWLALGQVTPAETLPTEEGR